MTKKALLDTNILVYGWDISNPLNTSISRFLDDLKHFCIVDRTLLEFYRVYTGPLKQSPESTLKIIDFYQNHPNYKILTSTDNINQLTFELAKKNNAKSGKIFDLNILATAIENDIEILYTKNVKDYPDTSFLQIVDPTL